MIKKISYGIVFSFLVIAAQAQVYTKKALQKVDGNYTLEVLHYNETNLVSKEEIEPDQKKDWQSRVTESAVNKDGSIDVSASFKLMHGTAPSTAVAFNFNFGNWSRDNYVLVPAIVYNGNRYNSIGNSYNPDYPGDMYYNPAVPLTISNDPRLAIERNKASLIELQTGNAATPAMCFFSPAEKKGFIVLTGQGSKFGNYGLSIAENSRQDTCSFTITAPAMRKYAAGFGDFHKSGDIAPDWNTGDSLTIHFKLYVFDANNIPDLLTKFMQVRKAFTGKNHPRNWLPMSKLEQLATTIFSNDWIEEPVGDYYKMENSIDFQLGWVSGMINTYPMLALNDDKERKRVGEELDFVVNKMQGKSGFFYGGITHDGKLRPEKMTPAHPAIQAMARKNGDALVWFIKHLLLLKAQGHGDFIKPEWESAAKKLARAFVNTWKKYGQFGQYIVPETGEIAVYNSTAGAIAPAGLALASNYFHDPEFLKIAEASAEYYYKRDVVKQGLTGGDCGDISMDANSESAFGFLESLMALYHSTKNVKWLERAKVEAALCATWVLSYDEKFPPSSQSARLHCHMAGAVFASIQNKHAAPGICTSSGNYLFKLYRATGNNLYADLINDIQHAQAEAVNIPPDHITTNNLVGSSMERIQPSDAEGRGSVGNFINTRNGWTITDGALMALELPGIYLQTDTKLLRVFDHVEAKIIKSNAKGITLSVTNKTQYDASVALFAETSAEAAQPLSYTAFVHWPKVFVRAGETIEVDIDKNGEVKALSLKNVKLWPSQVPADCPVEQSKEYSGLGFTGNYANYGHADTWYPSWGADDRLYSPFTDGEVTGLNEKGEEVTISSSSGGNSAVVGHAIISGSNPMDLLISDPGVIAGSPHPYGGRYPCACLYKDGVWYIGTYALNTASYGLNWAICGPFAGFDISKDNGKTWIPSPLSCEPGKALFPEPEIVNGPVKFGVPHIVDFGKNMENSPDGKMYMVAHGSLQKDQEDRKANLSWITGDQIYLCRVVPSPETVNNVKAYEYFGGHNSKGKPIWTNSLSRAKPILDWNNTCGGVTVTYDKPLKKYLMCVTNGGNTESMYDSYILEADKITGPWKRVTYMKNFGTQAYFLNIPSKFISPDGRSFWICYSANWQNQLGKHYASIPAGGTYSMTLQQVRLLTPKEILGVSGNVHK